MERNRIIEPKPTEDNLVLSGLKNARRYLAPTADTEREYALPYSFYKGPTDSLELVLDIEQEFNAQNK